jgi:predicted secreted protein
MDSLRSLAIALPLLFVSCSHPTEVIQQSGAPLDASVNGTVVVYPVNQSFTLTLDVAADAGYTWDCVLNDEAVVTMDRSPSIRPKNAGPVVPGGASVECFYFRSTGAGETAITLVEHQAWMKDVAPIASISFTAIVR